MTFKIIASILFTLILGFTLIPLLKKFIIDLPNIRSSHKNATPTSGGIIFIIPICTISILLNDYSPIYCLPLAFVGLIDDRFNINSIFRYLTQIFTVILIFFNSNISETILPLQNGFIYFLIIIFIGTAIINFVNFMDGLDGLVAGTMFVTFGMFFIMNFDLINIIIAGSLFSFLIYNWSPAKVFMGDVGSTFIAALYLSKLFNGSEFINIYMPIIALSPFWFDCIFCLLRRIRAKQNIFKAHNLHLYQRLNQAGWTHAQVSFLYILSTSFLILANLLNNLLISTMFSLLVLCFGFILDKKFAKQFNCKAL